MKEMIYYEFKKMIDKKVILLFLSLLVFNIFHIISINYNETMSSFFRGKNKIIEQIEGTITQEKVNFLQKELNKNIQLVDSGQYNTQDSDPNTYTGYVYGDMNAFEEVYNDLKRIYDYEISIKEKIKILEQNNSKKSLDEYSFTIKNKLQDRYITSYYDTSGVEKYINYSDSIIFILIIILYVSTNYLYYDRNFDMEQIVSITQKGYKKINYIKFLSTFIFAIIVTLCFFIFDFITFFILYDVNGLLNPIYSLTQFGTTYFNINILEFIFLLILLKLMIIIAISSISLLLSKKIVNSYISLIISFIISLLAWVVFFYSNHIFNLLNNLKTFSMHPIFSFYIHDSIIVLLILFFITVINVKTYLKKGKK